MPNYVKWSVSVAPPHSDCDGIPARPLCAVWAETERKEKIDIKCIQSDCKESKYTD